MLSTAEMAVRYGNVPYLQRISSLDPTGNRKSTEMEDFSFNKSHGNDKQGNMLVFTSNQHKQELIVKLYWTSFIPIICIHNNSRKCSITFKASIHIDRNLPTHIWQFQEQAHSAESTALTTYFVKVQRTRRKVWIKIKRWFMANREKEEGNFYA